MGQEGRDRPFDWGARVWATWSQGRTGREEEQRQPNGSMKSAGYFSLIFVPALVLTCVAHAYSANVEYQISHWPGCMANLDRDGTLK